MSNEKISENSSEKTPANADQFCNFEEFDDFDPLKAYFSQRFSRGSTSSLFKYIESDSGSSLGVLDIDNEDVLEEIAHLSFNDKSFEDSKRLLNDKKLSGSSCELSTETDKDANNVHAAGSKPVNSEANLKKQRELTKKTLLKLQDKLEMINKNLKYLETDKSPENMTKIKEKKLSLQGIRKNWLDYNQSPHTPKFFKDELSSLNDSLLTVVPTEKVSKKQSSTSMEEEIAKNENRVSKAKFGSNYDIRTSDMGFQSLNTADILSRLESDEKKFVKEQTGISNNSDISQFSGVIEDGVVQCLRPSTLGKELTESDRVSIGKYFELRSNSVNSLVGRKYTEEDKSTTLGGDEIQLKKSAMEKTKIDEKKDECTEIPEEPSLRDSNLYCDPPRISEAGSITRNSNESSGSTSTLLIQNLICGMESGLSGNEINDRLLECVGKLKNLKKNNNLKKDLEHMETPKSSKIGGKVSNFRTNNKGKLDQPKSSLVQKKPASTTFSTVSTSEFKENMPETVRACPQYDKKILTLKNESVKRNKRMKEFDSSTPKLQNKSHTDKFRSACSKLVMNEADWELPRVSYLRNPVNLSFEDCDKTLTVSSSVTSYDKKQNNIVVDEDVPDIEEALAAGDLTLISERIVELKESSAHTVRPSSSVEKEILAVVQELSNYPNGSIDCTAITPLLRDQFPQLLTSLPSQGNDTFTLIDDGQLTYKLNESVPTPPGCWMNIKLKYGFEEKIFVTAEVKKLISTYVKNLTNDWLIVSLESVNIQVRDEKHRGTKVNDEFHVEDFITIWMKDTLVLPDMETPIKIFVTPAVPVTLHIKLTLRVKKIKAKECQIQNLLFRLECIIPENNIETVPVDEINFGTIPEECKNEKLVQVVFDGIHDIPIKVFVDESQHFILSPEVTLDGVYIKDAIWEDSKFCYILREGRKRVLEFKVIFQPKVKLVNTKYSSVVLKETFTVAVNMSMKNTALREIPLVGCAAFAKFLCNPSCSPLIFRTTEIGKPVIKSFPLKNVGAIGLEFCLTVISQNSDQSQDKNFDLFSVPNAFQLPKGEERSIEIVFSGKTKETYVRRYLMLQLKPNGKVFYEVELVGIVMPKPRGESISQTSSHSGPTQYERENVNFKIKSTTQCISWAAVPLDDEVKQTFHIMNTSNCNAMARFSFRKEKSAFKFLNEKGEMIEKLKRVLKPNCSNVMTLVFRPDTIGPHNNYIIIETNHLSGKKMISVNGYGGSPKIFIKNLKSELNGSKNIRLVNSQPESQIFQATIEFINKGNVSGFVSIKTITKVLSVSTGLEIDPPSFVLPPNCNTEVHIKQKLKSEDIKLLLSGRDIGKIATVTVTTGDEPSRLRLKKLFYEQGIKISETIGFLLNEFIGESQQDITKFDDDKHFENVFRKTVDNVEIAAVIERPMDACEPTIIEDFEETAEEFVTILPAADYSLASFRECKKFELPLTKNTCLDKSNFSGSSGETVETRKKNITKWLESLEN